MSAASQMSQDCRNDTVRTGAGHDNRLRNRPVSFCSQNEVSLNGKFQLKTVGVLGGHAGRRSRPALLRTQQTPARELQPLPL